MTGTTTSEHGAQSRPAGPTPRQPHRDCDRQNALTRSLLGYGVIAGPLYLAVGLTQAFVRDGFDLSRHPLSLLANGPFGWIQTANLVVVGLITVAAAVGMRRALSTAPDRDPAESGAGRAPALVAVYGLGLVAAGLFKADPMGGFPAGAPAVAAEVTGHGVAHMAASGIGFICLVAACFALAGRLRGTPLARWAGRSRAAGAVTLVSFILGAGFAQSSAGVAGLWLAVVVAWAWLAAVCSGLYRALPAGPDPASPAGR